MPCCTYIVNSKNEKWRTFRLIHYHLAAQKLPRSRQRIERSSEIFDFRGSLVRVGRLELPASSSQSWRAASCATPGYSFFSICRCGQTCGQRPMFEQIAGREKCGNPSNCKGLRDFSFCPNAGGVTRSQSRRPTSWATPGYSIVSGCAAQGDPKEERSSRKRAQKYYISFPFA